MERVESINQKQSTAEIDPLITESQNTILSPSVTSTAPGHLKIIKRNGAVVGYESDKIAVAMPLSLIHI